MAMADAIGLRSHANALFARDGGLHPPPEVTANWPKANHIDPEERGWGAPIVLLVVLAATFFVYIARMWARFMLSKNAGLDDLLISLAMLPLFGLTIASILAIRVYGFQWHAWDQTTKTLVASREITMTMELTYMVSTTLIKVSILCFYRRITGSLTNKFVYWVWGTMILCIVYGILFSLLILLVCSPVIGFFRIFDVAWRRENELSCHNEGAIIVACAAISTVQDLVICALPVLLIWNLQIGKRQKIALCGIFGMGLITCLCGIMRTYYATYVYYYTYDITWYAYYGWIWTALEAQLGVICASAPALKVFFKRYFKISSTRIGYSGSDSRKTPGAIRSRGYSHMNPIHSAHSAARSHIVTTGHHDSDVPLDSIKVSQGLDISVEERDDRSQKSFASTRNLTALPNQPGWKNKYEWYEGCRSVCATLKPGSRNTSRSRSREGDVERGPAGP